MMLSQHHNDFERNDMQDLINLMVTTVGITEEQAKQSVNAVLGYVRDKLPAPIAAQVDTFLASGGAMILPGLSDLMKTFAELGQTDDGSSDASGMDPKLVR